MPSIDSKTEYPGESYLVTIGDVGIRVKSRREGASPSPS